MTWGQIAALTLAALPIAAAAFDQAAGVTVGNARADRSTSKEDCSAVQVAKAMAVTVNGTDARIGFQPAKYDPDSKTIVSVQNGVFDAGLYRFSADPMLYWTKIGKGLCAFDLSVVSGHLLGSTGNTNVTEAGIVVKSSLAGGTSCVGAGVPADLYHLAFVRSTDNEFFMGEHRGTYDPSTKLGTISPDWRTGGSEYITQRNGTLYESNRLDQATRTAAGCVWTMYVEEGTAFDVTAASNSRGAWLG